MFIGEAPGYHEDISGFPFVGSAVKLLTDLLNYFSLTSFRHYFITPISYFSKAATPPTISNNSPVIDS